VLREGARGASSHAGRPRVRQALVVAEIAFALAVLVAAGLILTSGARLVTQPGGFDPDRLMTLELSVPEKQYSTPALRRELADVLLAGIQATPGVQSATLSSILPAAGYSPSISLAVEDRPLTDDSEAPTVGYQSVSPGYFAAMKIPLVSGREFSIADREDGQPVAVISEAIADHFWPGESALGRRVRLGDGKVWHTVVGVARNVTMYNWWDGVDYQRAYVPLRQGTVDGVLYAAVRAAGDPAGIVPSLGESIRSVNRALPIQRARTMAIAIQETSFGLNFLALLMAICGAIAGLLAMVGIYGMMAYSVAARRQEFGVRIALGGTSRDMLRLTLKQAARLTAIGLAAGTALALLFGWALRSALFGLVGLDPATFAIVVAALAMVSFLAAYLPARRTLGLDPAVVLRD
jgi:putative ABC transport system permease protein